MVPDCYQLEPGRWFDGDIAYLIEIQQMPNAKPQIETRKEW